MANCRGSHHEPAHPQGGHRCVASATGSVTLPGHGDVDETQMSHLNGTIGEFTPRGHGVQVKFTLTTELPSYCIGLLDTREEAESFLEASGLGEGVVVAPAFFS